MHDKKMKQKLLKELEKIGNVSSSCLKVGINKATFYRWKKASKKFTKDANSAIRIGRENIADIAEQALLIKVKEKHYPSIKYVLSHNSKRYKPKSRKVYIEHSNSSKDYLYHARESDRKEIDRVSDNYKKLVENLRKTGQVKEINNEIRFVDFSRDKKEKDEE